MTDVFLKSPLNYTGGKYRLLKQIIPLFPQNIECFYDLFCGGANVGINVNANQVICNDNNEKLIHLLNMLKEYEYEELYRRIKNIIKEYELSESSENGYEYYNCNSADGLSGFNKEKYLLLRADLNIKKEKDEDYYIMLFVLIVYAFNNQIRFNNKGEFNLPVGKRDFNTHLQNNLELFVSRIKKQKIDFRCNDFRKIKIDTISADDFVYCDPPYLISTASYNEQDGWTKEDDKELLHYLDLLNEKSVRFALSNVIDHKGKRNIELLEWAKKYNIHFLDYNYKNASYHGVNTEKETKEVLITNY